ncbi:major pollen allergen Lig v 1-like [Lycium ferocissimum]|uniref:major pollen allergen Lig v 1-like n=1 Tax=Lycium ferocissimum TaxID=112874 RepID=UPI0028154541|nr:major pollen allergen Lig v 1-like [Lycium ferocissimum]
MGKSIVIFIASAIFLFGITQAYDKFIPNKKPFVESDNYQFILEGIVYCDPCRAEFKTNLSQPLDDARVGMQCRHPETEQITITVSASTNSTGYYNMLIEGDHENEICETFLIRSPREDCNEIPNEGGHGRESSRVTLTNNNGISGKYRDANPLFFLAKKVAPECAQEFKEMEYIPELKDINQA